MIYYKQLFSGFRDFLYDSMEATRPFFGLQLDDFIISAYGKEQHEDNYTGSKHQAVAIYGSVE